MDDATIPANFPSGKQNTSAYVTTLNQLTTRKLPWTLWVTYYATWFTYTAGEFLSYKPQGMSVILILHPGHMGWGTTFPLLPCGLGTRVHSLIPCWIDIYGRHKVQINHFIWAKCRLIQSLNIEIVAPFAGLCSTQYVNKEKPGQEIITVRVC